MGNIAGAGAGAGAGAAGAVVGSVDLASPVDGSDGGGTNAAAAAAAAAAACWSYAKAYVVLEIPTPVKARISNTRYLRVLRLLEEYVGKPFLPRICAGTLMGCCASP